MSRKCLSAVDRRAHELDTMAAVLPMERRDELAELLTEQEIATLKHLVERGMGADNRIAPLTRLAEIKAQIGCKRRPGIDGGRPAVTIDNTLDRQFDVTAPDTACATDITYVRTREGFAYLAVFIYLFSHRMIGWTMESRQTTDVVLHALLMAVWRRKPEKKC